MRALRPFVPSPSPTPFATIGSSAFSPTSGKPMADLVFLSNDRGRTSATFILWFPIDIPSNACHTEISKWHTYANPIDFLSLIFDSNNTHSKNLLYVCKAGDTFTAVSSCSALSKLIKPRTMPFFFFTDLYWIPCCSVSNTNQNSSSKTKNQ